MVRSNADWTKAGNVHQNADCVDEIEKLVVSLIAEQRTLIM
jgi:hypothetical protein